MGHKVQGISWQLLEINSDFELKIIIDLELFLSCVVIQLRYHLSHYFPALIVKTFAIEVSRK